MDVPPARSSERAGDEEKADGKAPNVPLDFGEFQAVKRNKSLDRGPVH